MARTGFRFDGNPVTAFAAEDIPGDAQGLKMLGVTFYDAAGGILVPLKSTQLPAALGQGTFQIDDAGIVHTVAALEAVFNSAEKGGEWVGIG